MLIGFLRSQLAHARLETLAEVITSTLIPALTLAWVTLRLRETRLLAPVRPLADARVMLRSRRAARRLMEYAAQARFVYQTLAAQVTSAIRPLVNTLDRRVWALAAEPPRLVRRRAPALEPGQAWAPWPRTRAR